MRLHGLSYLERRGGGRLQRRHPGSEAIDWPTGVSKHCCSRSPITQHALCSSKMCPTGTHRRIGDRFAPFAPSGAPLPSHLELVFFPLSVGNFGITSADWMGPLQAAAIALIGCGTWNYLGLTAQPLHAPASSTSRAGWQFRLAGKVSSLALFMTIPAFATLNSPPPPPNFKAKKQRFRPLELHAHIWISNSALCQTKRVFITYQTRHKSEYISVSSVHQSNLRPPGETSAVDATAQRLYNHLCGGKIAACMWPPHPFSLHCG